MNWLKRLLHLEEPEPVEKPEPEPPVVEPCPICGLVPKLKHVCVARNYLDYCLEKDKWRLFEWCDHGESILSFAPLFESDDVQKWNTACQRLKTTIDEPIPECPACGETPTVQPDLESDIPPACLLVQRIVEQLRDSQHLPTQGRVDISLQCVETQAGQLEGTGTAYRKGVGMKKIRVDWNGLKPGDLIHVKGSTNTYKFKSRIDWDDMIKVEVDGVGVSATWKLGVEKEPASMFLVVYKEDFDYATRPAPKKPRIRIEEPVSPGEYWARIQTGEGETWAQIIKAYSNSYVLLYGDNDKHVYQVSGHSGLRGYSWMTWEELLQVNKQTPILELLSAEEYYTRKAKGQL